MTIRVATVLFFLTSGAVSFGATYHVAQTTTASDQNSGTAEAPFRTISHAAKLAQPGDTVLVHAGVYRECVRPIRGGGGADTMITYMAAQGEEVAIKGSNLFSPEWRPAAPSDAGLSEFVCADLPEALFEQNPRLKDKTGRAPIYNPFNTALQVELFNPPRQRYRSRDPNGPPCLVVGEVYVLGKPLRQVVARLECQAFPGTYCITPDGKQLYVHFLKFTKGAVEITVRQQCFAPQLRGLGYIRVAGFVMEQCANQGPFPQAGILSTRSGHHWVVENNTLRHAATLGLDCGSELACFYQYSAEDLRAEGEWAPGSTPAIYETSFIEKGWQPLADHVNQPAPARGHAIRNNTISDNGLSGIMALKADDLLIEGNVVERNNRRCLYAGVENYAMGTCESSGIKLHLTRNSIIRDNLVRDNEGWASGIWLDNNNDNARITGNLILNNFHGIDLEINTGPILVDNNIVGFSRTDGLSVRDSSQVRFVQNLVIHSGRWGCSFNYTAARGSYFGRQFGPPRDCAIANNVFAGSLEASAIRLPMPSKERRENTVSGNLIEAGLTHFQLEDCRQTGTFSIAEFAAAARHWCEQARLPKEAWPKFEEWKGGDRWSLGVCEFASFNAIAGAPSNRWVPLAVPAIFSRVDQYSRPSANAWPARESGLPGLAQAYELKIDASTWTKVGRFMEVDTDYLGESVSPDSPYPGPLQRVSQNQVIAIWPKHRIGPRHPGQSREGGGGP